MKNTFGVGVIIFALLPYLLSAQSNVHVSHMTGTASVSIPLCDIQGVPIGIGYSAQGIKAKQVSGLAGIGWHLNAGGFIARDVRGIPDDMPTGWLNNAAGSKVDSFSIGTNTTCADEYDEYALLDSLYNENDTQPDIFYINSPLISGKFLFDSNGDIQVQPFQDIQISYSLTNSFSISDKIGSFEITDDQGVKYFFSVPDLMKRSIDFEEDEIFFKEAQDHQTGLLEINAEVWHLEKVIWPNGEFLSFAYRSEEIDPIAIKAMSYFGITKNYTYNGSSEGSFGTPVIPHETNLLESISSSTGEKVVFYTTSLNEDIQENRLSRIEKFIGNESLVAYTFYYDDVYPISFSDETPDQGTLDYEKKTFLKTILPSYNGVAYTGYEFDYYGVYDYYTELPKNTSSQVDFYGYFKPNGSESHEDGVIYYNPELSAGGQYSSEPLTDNHPYKIAEVIQIRDLRPDIYYNSALSTGNQYRIHPLPSGHANKSTELLLEEEDRTVDTTGVHYGSISKLTYPTGGNVSFFYEPTTFYDETAEETYYGPGVRLKKTIVHDEVNSDNDIITSYEYSNGVIIDRPIFAFGTTYSPEENLTYSAIINSGTLTDTEKAEHLSIRTNFDMSSGNLRVLYPKVTVVQPNKGRVEYNFEIPALVDDASANSSEWTPSEHLLASDSSSSTACYVTGRLLTGSNVYPFAKNPNYDFERGLVSSIKAFDDDDNPVSESTYSYTRTTPSGTTNAVYGMVIDKVPTYRTSEGIQTMPRYLYSYSKYRIFSNVRNSVSQIIKSTYDPQDTTKKLTTTTDLQYDATNKRLSKSSSTNSTGVTVNSYTKYIADYVVDTTPSDLATAMIDSLQNQHRIGMSTESYQTLQPAGGSERVVGGSILTFNEFDKRVVHPYKQYQVLDDTTLLSNFSVSEISSGQFQMDDSYVLSQTFTSYDINERPNSIASRTQIAAGTHWGYSSNIALANSLNSAADNFLYSGFEDDTGFDLEVDPAYYSINPYVTGRTGANALDMQSGSSYGLLGELAISGYSKNLVLSFWSKSTSSGSMSYSVKNLDGTTTYVSSSLSFSNDTDWTYYEALIDATSFPSDIQILIYSNQDLSVDDILVYPEEATITYRAFGDKREILSESLAGKTTSYFEYDELLRNTLVRDDDKYILSKNEFDDMDVDAPLNPFFNYLGLDSSGDAVFELEDTTATSYDYTWTFGDDSVALMTGQYSITHTYHYEKSYTVRLKVKSGLDSAFSIQTIEAVDISPEVLICATGPSKIDKCLNYVTTIFNEGCANTTGYSVAPTVFTFQSISNYPNWESQPISYSWEVDTGSGWTEVGTDESISLFYTDTFDVRCEVSLGSGTPTVITSDSKQVVLFKSDSQCTEIYNN